jgi:ATP-dependent DNA ligase
VANQIREASKSGYALEMPRVPAVIPEPMLARLTDRVPTGPAWSYEVKWDGHRCLALKVGDAVTLRSRNASNLTASYPAVAAALRTLKAQRALLDGEIVALDQRWGDGNVESPCRHHDREIRCWMAGGLEVFHLLTEQRPGSSVHVTAPGI